jgi:hypothetical protein
VREKTNLNITLFLLFILNSDTDIWKLCLDIIDAYVVLDANLLFQVVV